jgi:hypothetical protein
MDDRVVLRSFSYRAEAEIVCELLGANGIEAFVNSDDCGAVDPALQFGRGAEVLVNARDRDAAERLIEERTADALMDDEPEPVLRDDTP